MYFSWTVPPQSVTELGKFLHHHGISKSLFAKVKYHGGEIYVNHHRRYSSYPIYPGDHVLVVMPPEKEVSHLVPVFQPVNVLFEDAHFLIVNKPAGLPSIPTRQIRHDSMANRVKGYLIQTHNESKSVHVVTRLDQDTSGAMMFTKHALAHSLIAKQLHSKTMEKFYLAVAHGHFAKTSGLINEPIGRSAPYSMKRAVRQGGKAAQTYYQVQKQFTDGAVVKLQLLTGRTHQIRVHLSWLGHPLYGDELYGHVDPEIGRQALHCQLLRFMNPFTGKWVSVQAPLPEDMQSLIEKLKI